MEQRDLELIHRHLEKDINLRKLYEEHLDLEKKLDDLACKPYLTPAEEMERSKLKKIKLRGRDQMEAILNRLRKKAGTL
jgi:uncharacterized protein YdcH (DUF465 family)